MSSTRFPRLRCLIIRKEFPDIRDECAGVRIESLEELACYEKQSLWDEALVCDDLYVVLCDDVAVDVGPPNGLY